MPSFPDLPPAERITLRRRLPIEARVFDAHGREVSITQTCTKCGRTKPLASFGLRRMDDGKIRSIPQCKTCRGGRAVEEGPAA